MPMRVFQISIILFWVISLGWLVKTVTTPDHAGMVEIDPRRPISAFFNLNDSSRMALLRDGQKIGELNVSRQAADEENQRLPGFSISGSLISNVEPYLLGSFCSVLLSFNENYSPASAKVILRVPSRNLNVHASIDEKTQALKADVRLAGAQIFSYNGDASGKPNNPQLEAMVRSNPMVSGLIDSAASPEQWKSNTKAYRGMHRLAGKRIPVYLVELEIESLKQKVKIYFSESGEPLQVETDLGYTAISEVLVPIEPASFPK